MLVGLQSKTVDKLKHASLYIKAQDYMGLLLTFFFCVFTGAVAVVAQNATASNETVGVPVAAPQLRPQLVRL
jgi:hypothetical protein